jgi:hypothetical protein
MQILVNTDNNVMGHESVVRLAQEQIHAATDRFGDLITRVEVHLADENAHKPGEGTKRCTLEARPAGHEPVSVTCHADTVGAALTCAVRKLEALLDSRLERERSHKGGASIRTGPR